MSSNSRTWRSCCICNGLRVPDLCAVSEMLQQNAQMNLFEHLAAAVCGSCCANQSFPGCSDDIAPSRRQQARGTDSQLFSFLWPLAVNSLASFEAPWPGRRCAEQCFRRKLCIAHHLPDSRVQSGQPQCGISWLHPRITTGGNLPEAQSHASGPKRVHHFEYYLRYISTWMLFF